MRCTHAVVVCDGRKCYVWNTVWGEGGVNMLGVRWDVRRVRWEGKVGGARIVGEKRQRKLWSLF